MKRTQLFQKQKLHSHVCKGFASCLQMTAPESYFQNKACNELKYFVCEVDRSKKFSAPQEGNYY